MGRVDKQGPSGPQKPQASALSYTSYLKVDALTDLQSPLATPAAHDEMLFIIVHQTYELWFKQVLYEMRALVEKLGEGELLAAFRLLDRLCEIFRVLIQQVDVLETMTPVEFNRFRDGLNPASGFQSQQFREFELLAGAPVEDFQKFLKLNPEWSSTVTQRMEETTLRAAFIDILLAEKLITSPETEQIIKAVQKIYHDPKLIGLHNLCEYLIRFDEQVLHWRFRHVQMVERMIGMKPGTGGSLGVNYLQQTLRKKFFQELWDARTGMGGSYS